MNTSLAAIGIITGFGFVFGFILGFAAFYFRVKDDPIIEKVNYILPQIQCAQCGYPNCHSYAEAIVNNSETINKCTLGGKQVILKIAELLNTEPQGLDKAKIILEQKVAFINEINCVGCSKCIKVCPVDAIVGTTGTLHTVIEKFCTGCNLCAVHCPTDCINMLPKN